MEVASVMTRDVVTVSPTTPLADVAKLLADYEIDSVPVVDEDGDLVGIVTRADLAKAFVCEAVH